MSVVHDSSRQPSANLPLMRRLATNLDDMAGPARLLKLYFMQRAELKAAKRAIELSLKPKIRIHLQCKTPSGHNCVDIHL
jgi:hypothetical protein